jgi:outer membrane biosynthesis protein TonB
MKKTAAAAAFLAGISNRFPFRTLWVLQAVTAMVLVGLNLPLSAQRNLALYNLQGVPQSYQLNPGRMPWSNGFLAMPAVGNINLNYSNNGFDYSSLKPLIEAEEENGIDFEDFLSALSTDNRMVVDVQANWFDFGIRVKQNFFGLSVSEQAFAQVDFPKTLFELFNDIDLGSPVSQIYDLSGLHMNASHYRAYAFSFTRQINPRLSAGARVKLLTGFLNAATENTGLAFINNTQNAYLGIRNSFSFLSSGYSTLENSSSDYLKGRGNSGFAFDAGAQFQLLDNLEVFASIVNVGSINWKNDLTVESIMGTDYMFPTDDFDAFQAEVEDLLDSLTTTEMIGLPAYRTKLPTNGYLGANYYFAPQTSVGVLFNPRIYNGAMDLAFSLGVQTRVKRLLQLGVNYSIYNRNAFNLGAGMGLNLGPLQIFLASDNILSAVSFQNAQNAHANLGLSLAFGRRTREEQLALWNGADAGEETEDDDELASLWKELEETAETGPKATRPDKETSKPAKAAKQPKQKTPPPAKTAPQKEAVEPAAAPVQPTPRPSAAAPATGLKRYFTLLGSAQAASSGAPITSIQVDAFVQLPGGTEQLASTNSFFNGSIQVLLEREKTYRIVVRKPQYASQEFTLTPSDMEGKNSMERVFILPSGN